MKWLRKHLVLPALFSSIFLFWTSASSADTQIRVIVDASGSMLISDPDKLTSEALRLISNLAPEEEATLGVWLFGEAPRVLLPEAPVNKVTKEKLARYVNGYVTEDVKTDLEAIVELLLDTPDSGELEDGFDRHWILVTDGMVDISLDNAENWASRERILNELVDRLNEADIHLHTVSMTGYTDKSLLQSLSLSTNAIHTEVAVPEDLLDTFNRIFSQASPADELPFNGNTFMVDDSIEELTLVVFHEKGQLPEVTTPSGGLLPLQDGDGVSIAASEHYTLLTIRDPEVGMWQVANIDLERSNIRVITHLSAQATKVAPVVFENEEVHSTVGLFEKDILLQDDSVLELLTVTQTLSRLHGEQKKEEILHYGMPMEDKQFKSRLNGITESGQYQLVSVVNGKTFTRQLSQYFTVHPAIELSGESIKDDVIILSAKPVSLKLNLLRSTVSLDIIDENGDASRQEMPLVGQGYWEKVVGVSPTQNVKVRVNLLGVTQTGVSFQYQSPYWVLERENLDTPVLNKEGSVQSILLSPTSSSNRQLMPLDVPPQVTLVEESNSVEQNEEVVENKKVQQQESVEEDNDNEMSFSADEWVLYMTLNLAGVLVIASAFLIYRRLKNKQTKIGNDVNDV